MKTSTRRLGLRAALVATAVGTSVGLAGCVQTNGPLPGGAFSSSASGQASAPATPTTSPTPSPSSSPTRFTENCSILLTAAQLYDYNPNYVVDSAYAPSSGTVPASIARDLGQTCGWVNETSGTEIEIAIATPGADLWTAAKATASAGTPISTAGQHGFFAVKKGVGSAQFFFGSLWLDISSSEFVTADDAAALYPVIVKNQLTAGG